MTEAADQTKTLPCKAPTLESKSMGRAPVKKAIKDTIVAQWRTGQFTQRVLADRHKVSNALVAKLTKGIPHDCEQIVSAGIQYRQGLEQLCEQNLTKVAIAVSEIVDDKFKASKFFANVAIQNVQEAMRLPCAGQLDIKLRADTILKGREAVLGKEPTTAVQINNNSGGDGSLTVTYE